MAGAEAEPALDGGTPTRPRPQRGVLAAEPRVYGTSVQGRPLEIWGEGELLIVAGLHGEEPETTVTLSSALRTLAPGELRCAVVLGANPDGLARGTRGNANGVDLNRNFPAPDWAPHAVTHHFTRAEPQDVLLSPGPAPASEPETRALMELVLALRPSCLLSLHAPLACVIDPHASAPARWLSERSGLRLKPGVPSPTPGMFDSWFRQQFGAPAVTLELPVISKDEALRRFVPLLLDVLAGGVDGFSA